MLNLICSPCFGENRCFKLICSFVSEGAGTCLVTGTDFETEGSSVAAQAQARGMAKMQTTPQMNAFMRLISSDFITGSPRTGHPAKAKKAASARLGLPEFLLLRSAWRADNHMICIMEIFNFRPYLNQANPPVLDEFVDQKSEGNRTFQR